MADARRPNREHPTPAVALVLVVAASLVAPAIARPADVVARVNGAPITLDSVHELVRSVVLGRKPPPSSVEIAKISEAARDSLIELELLYQEAVARGFTVSQAEVDAEIARTSSRFATAAEFRAALEERGLSEERLQSDTRRALLASRLVEAVAWQDVRVSDEEARAFYDKHPEEFGRRDEVRVRRLLVAVPEQASPGRRNSARRRAENLARLINDGGDFAALARQHSDDAASAARGGDLGFVAAGELAPAAEKAVARLAVGQTSAPVETPAGYEILQVTERRTGARTRFEDVRPSIVAALTEAEREEHRRAFVAALGKKAKIELVPEAELSGKD